MGGWCTLKYRACAVAGYNIITGSINIALEITGNNVVFQEPVTFYLGNTVAILCGILLLTGIYTKFWKLITVWLWIQTSFTILIVIGLCYCLYASAGISKLDPDKRETALTAFAVLIGVLVICILISAVCIAIVFQYRAEIIRNADLVDSGSQPKDVHSLRSLETL